MNEFLSIYDLMRTVVIANIIILFINFVTCFGVFLVFEFLVKRGKKDGSSSDRSSRSGSGSSVK